MKAMALENFGILVGCERGATLPPTTTTLGLQEGSFGSQFITSSMNKKIYMKSHMPCKNNVGWDSREFFQDGS